KRFAAGPSPGPSGRRWRRRRSKRFVLKSQNVRGLMEAAADGEPRAMEQERIREKLAEEDTGARARQGARADEQRGARPVRDARDRGEDALLEHRGRPSRPRPPEGRPARDAARRPAGGAAQEGGRREGRPGRGGAPAGAG